MPSADASLYLVAKGGVATANKASGDNPAIALMAVVGNKPPARVVINEMTTVASVWTHAQFIDGTAIKGHALGLRSPLATCPTSLISQPAGGGGRSRVRSTAARRPRWRISPHWPTCWPDASRA